MAGSNKRSWGMVLIASSLALVALTTTLSGYYATTATQVKEWVDLQQTPFVVTPIFEVPEQVAVVYVVNPDMTMEGVLPVPFARCRSPGPEHFNSNRLS